MEEQIRWYLMASSVIVGPLFILAVAHWWSLNKGVHDSGCVSDQNGHFAGYLAWMPSIIFILFTSRHPLNDYSTLRIGCRWLGQLLALVALVCGFA